MDLYAKSEGVKKSLWAPHPNSILNMKFYVKTAVFGPIYIILWLLSGIKLFFYTVWENVKNMHFIKKKCPNTKKNVRKIVRVLW